MKYIRFVVGKDGENARLLSGVFSESNLLIDNKRLVQYERKLLRDIYSWFNDHLPCPPWSRNNWGNAVSWYKSDASSFIAKMWDIVHILRDNGQQVRMLKSDNPGRVVYEDYYQVVVFEWAHTH